MMRWIWIVVFVMGCSDDDAGGTANGADTGGKNDTTFGFAGDAAGDGVSPADSFGAKDNNTPTDMVASDDADTPGTCADGTIGCFSATTLSVCVGGSWQFLQTCPQQTTCTAGKCGAAADCEPGAFLGCEGLASQWVCGADGKSKTAEFCSPSEQCIANTGCAVVNCTPSTKQCLSNTTYHTCQADGSAWGSEESCQPGTTCVGGQCLSLCEADIKYNTNVGCEYWSVDLNNDPTHHPLFPENPTPEMFPHSVVISNPGTSDAMVTFTVHVSCADGTPCSPTVSTCNGQQTTVCDTPTTKEVALNMGDTTVVGGSSREFKMPVMNVAGSGITKKAIRITSTLPVVAYQFNPFNSENAASNDGSLLLPHHVLGQEYYVVSLPSRAEITDLGGNPIFPANNGLFAVVPTQPNTTVSVTPTVEVIANPAFGVPQDGTTPKTLTPGQTYSFTLQPYEVLNLEQLGKTEIITPGKIPKDLTGTRVLADKPVAVFSGHQVAGVQEQLKLQITDVWDSCCTEHLEEQLMPVETWGTVALCVKSKPRGSEADRWIIVAGADGVLVNTEPPIDGINGKILTKAGDFLRVETTDSFSLAATGKIQVVQFLMSQGQTQPIGGAPGTGDPSMMIVPPSQQYRNEYVIRTADGFGTNWITVVRPAGVTVLVDGAAIADSVFENLGDGTWEYAYHQVSTGTHTVQSEQPFGLMVYGYGSVTAYGYPGGMLLEQEKN